MKMSINGLLKGRIARWCLSAAILAGVGLSLAWHVPVNYRLGGAFVGSGGAGVWISVNIPLDPEGRKAALRINSATYSPEFAGLFAALGATALGSDAVGEAEMISRDTARYGTVFYGRAEGPGNPLQINTIFVMTGTFKYLGPDTMEVKYTINVYPAATDVNGDGYPDPGAQPIVIPGVLPIQGVDIAKRVTLR